MSTGSAEKQWGPYDITWWQAALVGLVVFGILFTVGSADVEDRTSRPFENSMRRLFGAAVPLDPRIKILVTPDRGNGDPLTGDEWRRTFELLAKASPRAILVEHVFGAHYPPETARALGRAIRAAGNVIAAAWPVSELVESDHIMSHDRPDYDLRRLLGKPSIDREELRRELAWLRPAGVKFFGPDEQLIDAIDHVGHLSIDGSQRARYVRPFLRTSVERAIPYLALLAADSLGIDGKTLVANGRPIPLDRQARIPLIYPSIRDTRRALSFLVDYLAGGADIRQAVSPGDYVVIVPGWAIPQAARAGAESTDLRRNRLEAITGGFGPVAVLNGVLTGKWIHPVGGRWVSLLAACLLGALLGLLFRGPVFFLVHSACALLIVAAGLTAFIGYDLMLPWFFPTVGLLLCGLGVFMLRKLIRDFTARRLRRLLFGTVPPGQIEEIIENPARLELGAAEQVLTIMFIDIVGFSKASEKRPPKEIFDSLRDVIEDITRTVHEFGGVVDRTLGDGMLCVFGYSYGLELSNAGHADQAVECAIRIQSNQMRRALEAKREGRATHPLRIGINTTALYIGDLGGENRIDITVIGDGVNYAQRLEAACESYRVMIGKPTREALTNLTPSLAAIRHKLLAIKHHEKAVEAFEVDPFHDEPDRLDEALSVFRTELGATREDERWDLSPHSPVQLESEFGPARLVNFSRSGGRLVLAKYLSRGMQLTLDVSDAPGPLRDQLRRWGLSILVAEVRWARPQDDGYLHGVRLLNLSEEQQDTLVGCLRECLTPDTRATGT